MISMIQLNQYNFKVGMADKIFREAGVDIVLRQKTIQICFYSILPLIFTGTFTYATTQKDTMAVHDCPPTQAGGTVPPAIAICSITFSVAGGWTGPLRSGPCSLTSRSFDSKEKDVSIVSIGLLAPFAERAFATLRIVAGVTGGGTSATGSIPISQLSASHLYLLRKSST